MLHALPGTLLLFQDSDQPPDCAGEHFPHAPKVLPVCSPTVVTITILKVIECWNSYVWPRLITDNEKYYLVSNGIQEIRENGFGRENIPAMMAAVVVISIPLIILFLLFHNKIMEGVKRGGTKG